MLGLNVAARHSKKVQADAQVQIAKAAVAEVNALEAETKLLSPY